MNWRVVAFAPNHNCSAVEVTLRLMGDRLLPAVVTSRLGLSPTFAHAAGAVTEVGGRSVEARTGVWGWTVKATGPCSLEEQIVAVLRVCEQDPERFAALLDEYDLACDVSCLWSSVGLGGPVLSPHLLASLARHRCALNFAFLVLHEGRIEDYPMEQRYILREKDSLVDPHGGGPQQLPESAPDDG